MLLAAFPTCIFDSGHIVRHHGQDDLKVDDQVLDLLKSLPIGKSNAKI